MATWRLAWTVLVPFGVCFFISNYYRSMNAVLSPRLMSDLQLTATNLGLLTSVYFFTTALFQLPLGLLMDRYGPRRVQGALIALASAGVLIFAVGRHLPVLIFGRAIMGIGAAGALMTSFQAVMLWFPAQRWPLLNGLVLSAGGLGALAATLPTELVLHVTDWRHLMLGVAVASLVASALIFGIVPERVIDRASGTLREQLRGVVHVYSDRLFLRIAPVYAMTVGGNLAFQGLWAGPWLKDVAHLSSSQVARGLLVVAVLQTIGYVFIGWLAGVLGKHGIGLAQIIGTGTFLFIVTQAGLLLPTGHARWAVLLGMGLLANINLLSYPLLAQNLPAGLMGRANTALNFFVFLGAFFLQYAVGALIDLFEPVAPTTYPPLAYQAAFAVMCVFQAASWIWFLIPGKPKRVASKN
jgi:predicted MFS family arabinose efflux permease